MKQLLILIFLLFATITRVYTQPIDTCFSKKKILNIYNNIIVLEHRDSINTILIKEFNSVVIDYKSVMKMDSTTIAGQKIQINNLEENSKTWKKLYDTVNPKWYQKPPFMFATGIITTLLLFKLF